MVFASTTRFDLHLHTTRSDGRYDPDEVLRRCARGGLDVIALTDHDLPTGVPIGSHRIEDRDLYVIAGAELSGMHEAREHHLLVYFAGAVPEGFRAFCAEQCRVRATRYAAAIDRLGFADLAPPDEAARRGETPLPRHHLARELLEHGHVGHLREAFVRYLGDAHGLVPPLRVSFTEAIRIAREYGGVTSWAHPPSDLVDRFLPGFVAAGLEGLEGLRPGIASEDRRRCRNAARKYGLVLTGGSDWHGWGDDGDLGLFRVEAREIEPFLERLRSRSAVPDVAAAEVGR